MRGVTSHDRIDEELYHDYETEEAKQASAHGCVMWWWRWPCGGGTGAVGSGLASGPWRRGGQGGEPGGGAQSWLRWWRAEAELCLGRERLGEAKPASLLAVTSP